MHLKSRNCLMIHLWLNIKIETQSFSPDSALVRIVLRPIFEEIALGFCASLLYWMGGELLPFRPGFR